MIRKADGELNPMSVDWDKTYAIVSIVMQVVSAIVLGYAAFHVDKTWQSLGCGVLSAIALVQTWFLFKGRSKVASGGRSAENS